MRKIARNKKTKSKFAALALGIVFALFVIELSLRFFGFIEMFKAGAKHSRSAVTIMTAGNSHTFGTGAPLGKDYPAQLETLLNRDHPGHYSVINRGRVNVNTSYIREKMPDWLQKDRPNIVFIMAGEANHWNKYKYADFLDENHHRRGSFHLDNIYEHFRFLSTFKLGEILLNTAKSHSEFSNTFKGVSLKESQRALGYLWLGHLERESIYQTKNLSKEEAEEAISALKYIYEKDLNPAASRLIAAIYLQIFHDEDLFLEYMQKTLSITKAFNYEVWQLLRLNESLMGEKSRAFVKTYMQSLDYSSIPLSIKEMEEWYLFEKPLNLKSVQDEIAFVQKLSKANPTDLRLFESLQRKNASPEILIQVAERGLYFNPNSPQTDVLGMLKLAIKDRPELNERFNHLVEQTNKKAEIDSLKIIDIERNRERDWIISDLEAIIKMVELTGAKVVIQTYAPKRDGSFRFIDDVLRAWWKGRKKSNVEFMDVGLMLANKFKAENGGVQYYSTRFGDKDEHPGALGYYEIAKLMVPYAIPASH